MPERHATEPLPTPAPRIARLNGARVSLGPWEAPDLAAFAALNADTETIRWFPSVLDRRQSDDAAHRMAHELQTRGWGLWAARLDDGAFIGFVGLAIPKFEARFTPTVEIAWRLGRHFWGHGYATEAARLALDHAFGELALPEVVALTAAGNERSRRVMDRLGMTRDPADDFDHPALTIDSPLRRHVLYRIRRPDRPDKTPESAERSPERKDAP